MDLPRTVHPSRLSPHFVRGYVLGIGGAVVVVGIVAYAFPSLEFLPFPRVYLYALVLLPLLLAAKSELARHHHEYEFHGDRVLVREGIDTIEQEDVPYEKITDVSSTSPPWEQLVDVGDLEIHIAGRDRAVHVTGIRHPDRYEDLMLGRVDAGEPSETGTATDVETIRQQLQDVEEAYDRGEIGRAEYERNYYYYQGQLDLLEEREGEA